MINSYCGHDHMTIRTAQLQIVTFVAIDIKRYHICFINHTTLQNTKLNQCCWQDVSWTSCQLIKITPQTLTRERNQHTDW